MRIKRFSKSIPAEKIYRQKIYSWNSFLDKRIENSQNRLNKIKELTTEYRTTPLTSEEKRLTDALRTKILKNGVKLVETNNLGGGYTPNIDYLPKDVIEKFGINKEDIKRGEPFILANKNVKPYVLAHEYGHSTKDFISKHFSPKDGFQNHPLSLLLEETRANVKGYLALKNLKPDEKTLVNSRKGFMNIEKAYLERAYQSALKFLKTKK